MPFTLAHPAIMIPLQTRASRYQGLLSALIIGSMIPDFNYFLPLGVTRFESHTWFALLWFSLPLGLVFYLIYHSLLAPVVYSFLPGKFQRRIPSIWSIAGFGTGITRLIKTKTPLGSPLKTSNELRLFCCLLCPCYLGSAMPFY